eukprot:4318-Eustigmatos_ZCMA.PRE.1
MFEVRGEWTWTRQRDLQAMTCNMLSAHTAGECAAGQQSSHVSSKRRWIHGHVTALLRNVD